MLSTAAGIDDDLAGLLMCTTTAYAHPKHSTFLSRGEMHELSLSMLQGHDAAPMHGEPPLPLGQTIAT